MAPEIIDHFFIEQLSKWEMARHNFEALNGVEFKEIELADGSYNVMYNPARETSSAAKTDAKSIAERPCFLCEKNRPKEQMAYPILPGYSLLVNPFPIFDRHFTIPSDTHQPQSLIARDADGKSHIQVMCDLAKAMPGYMIFYNGAKCGASAPDHLHFQAVPKDYLLDVQYQGGVPFKMLHFGSKDEESFIKAVWGLITNSSATTENADIEEPMVNVFMFAEKDSLFVSVVPRRAHRPSFYGSGDGEMLISPGAVDVGGTLICCRKKDYDRIDASTLNKIFEETTYPDTDDDEN